MPYIKTVDRVRIDQWADRPLLVTVGEMNYYVTRLIHDYLAENGTNYANINACVGMLECCKLELYRRLAAPYEDTKIAENGDVFV